MSKLKLDSKKSTIFGNGITETDFVFLFKFKISKTVIIEKHKCTRYKNENICKNGKDSFNGKQKYHCLDCNSYGTLNAEPKYSFVLKKEIIDAYFERPSMRSIERIFKVSRQTLAAWLIELGEKEEFKDLNAFLNDVPQNNTLELDELCSFVQKKESGGEPQKMALDSNKSLES